METSPVDTSEFVELQELDQRRSDEHIITLWWVKNTLHTYVEVMNMKTTPPTMTEIPVVAPATAADVFNHPFAHLDDAR